MTVYYQLFYQLANGILHKFTLSEINMSISVIALFTYTLPPRKIGVQLETLNNDMQFIYTVVFFVCIV